MIKQDFASPGEKKTPIQANTGTFSRIRQLITLKIKTKHLKQANFVKPVLACNHFEEVRRWP